MSTTSLEPIPRGPAIRRGLSLLRAALRGQGIDPARDPLAASIVFLAVPMVLEMLMESIFVVVDIFFVSKLGADAVAAVGLTEAMLALLYTVAGGLSIGVTAMVARRTGERDADGAAATTVQAILLGMAVGLIGGLQAPRLLALMGAGDTVIALGSGYTRVMLSGSGVILLLFLINASFRGAGDAAIAMRVLWLANLINLILDPLLIFGIGPFPELGVTGAAVATTTGRSVAVLAQLGTLLFANGRLRLRARHLHLHPAVMARLVRLSATGMFQIFIATASWIGLTRILAGFGSAALAGYTISIRIVLFALLPAWGLANAAATLVGQSLGARDPGRAERAVWIAAFMNLVFLGAIGILILATAPLIVSWFGGDAQTGHIATHALRIVSAGFFFYAFGMVLTQSFNGAGATWTPTLLNLFCFWLWELPLAWVLSHQSNVGPNGVFASITIAFSTIAVASAWLFRRGHWKASVV